MKPTDPRRRSRARVSSKAKEHAATKSAVNRFERALPDAKPLPPELLKLFWVQCLATISATLANSVCVGAIDDATAAQFVASARSLMNAAANAVAAEDMEILQHKAQAAVDSAIAAADAKAVAQYDAGTLPTASDTPSA